MSVQGKLNQFKKIQTVCAKITAFKGQKADCNKNRASVVKQTPNGNKFCRYFKLVHLPPPLGWNIEYLFSQEDTIFFLNHLSSLPLSIYMSFSSGCERKCV